MSETIQLVLQDADNGSRMEIPGRWTPMSTIGQVIETIKSELSGVQQGKSSVRHLQITIPESKWFRTTLRDVGISQNGRALLIFQREQHPKANGESQVQVANEATTTTDLNKAIQLLFEKNFDADSKVCIITLMKVLDNVLQKPNESKVRTIRMANPAFAAKVVERPGGVEILLACGFDLVDMPPPAFSHPINPEKCLVLQEEKENIQHLVVARRLLMTKAVEELGMKADELPKFKPPPQHAAATANAMAINSSEFNPYKGYRYDAKAAAVGQNLGPEEDYVSPTELQLQALQSAKKSLENSLHQPIFEREITALLPNATPLASSIDSTLVAASDGSILAQQLQKREQDRRQRDEQGFTTKAMRDLEKLKKQKVYSHALLRMKFPDGSALEAKFLPNETVAIVKNVILESLLTTNLDFDLYVAPPRRKLSADSTLAEECLVPAANVFISWRAHSAPDKSTPTGAFLKPELFRSGMQPAYPSAVGLVPADVEMKNAVDDGPPKSSREDDLMRRMLGKSGLGGKPRESGGAKPKWFRG